MKNRSLAIALTVITTLVCLCLALVSCLSGGVSVYLGGQPGTFDLTGTNPYLIEPFSTTIGFVLVCVSFLFVLVPAVVGFLTLRKPKAEVAPLPPSEPLPPAS